MPLTNQSTRFCQKSLITATTLVTIITLSGCATTKIGSRDTARAIMDQCVSVLSGSRLSSDTKSRLVQAGLDEEKCLANMPACVVTLKQADLNTDKGIYGAISELFYASAQQRQQAKTHQRQQSLSRHTSHRIELPLPQKERAAKRPFPHTAMPSARLAAGRRTVLGVDGRGGALAVPGDRAASVCRDQRKVATGDLGAHRARALHLGGNHAVGTNGHAGHVLAADRRRASKAGHCIGGREGALVGVVLGNSGLGTRAQGHRFGNLRACHIVLVSRQRDGSQDGDDRNNDHQFDKGEALLVLHLVHPQDKWWLISEVRIGLTSGQLSGSCPLRVDQRRLRANPGTPPPGFPRAHDGSYFTDGNPPDANLRWTRQCDAVRHLWSAPGTNSHDGAPNNCPDGHEPATIDG